MKTTAKLMTMIILLVAGTCLMTQKAQAHRDIYVQVFYDELRPYGTWIDTPEYGYVWVPDVTPGFHPYGTSGYWVYTIYGWTWVSDYPWGWAPFHYGRWYYDNWYGWVWVPGTEWGPGWVSWRHCDGYYGWAPLTPGFKFSISYHMDVYLPANHWVFIPGRHFGDRNQERYQMSRIDNDRLYHKSRIIVSTTTDNDRNVRYFKGPEVKEVRRATGRDFKPVEVRDNNHKGRTMRNDKMEVYRPKVENNSVREHSNRPSGKYAPSKDRERKPETSLRYDPKPKDREMKMNNNVRHDNAYPRIAGPVQPSPRQYSPPSGNERRGKRN